MRARLVTLLLVALIATPTLAQFTPTPLVLEGDVIPGVGTITRVDIVAINNNGDWFVEVDTDNPDTTADSVLLRNGAIFLREGQGMTMPVGATLGSFDSVTINDNGDGGFNFFLDDVPSSENSGVYFNDVLVIQESDISGALAFTPGTPYIGFFDTKLNDNNVFLIVASVDDPAISSSVDRALVLAAVNASGTLMSEVVLAKEGDILPGQVEPVADFGTGPHQSAVNDLGQVLYFADLAGSTSTDGAIYLDLALLAQEGSPSPLPGRLWQFLSSRGMDLNNTGSYVFKANVDGGTSDDELIVLDGAVFRQEGDSLPVIAPFTFTSFGTSSGPVQVDDGGRVVWFGDWNDSDTDRDTGLFRDDTLLVREGVTTVGGVPIDTISSGSDAFVLSDDGSKLIFEATLDDGTNGAFMITLPTGGGGGPNEPPVAVCTDQTVIADDTCTADANVDAGSFDPDGDPITLVQSPPGPYPIGDTIVTLTVTDDKGASDSCMATVTVLDVVPPQISVVLSPEELWPPNHRLVDVTAIVTATDDCSTPAVELVSVVSDEADNAEGDGDTVDDIREDEPGTADFEFRLRAERSGLGSGRTYTATYLATDTSGNQTSGAGIAFTPHDQSGKTDPVDLSVDETAAGTVVSWNPVAGASYYNVIRGRLANLKNTADAYDLGHVICLSAHSTTTDTTGTEDITVPSVGDVFFYLVEYNDGQRSSYGTETAAKPRLVASGFCE